MTWLQHINHYSLGSTLLLRVTANIFFCSSRPPATFPFFPTNPLFPTDDLQTQVQSTHKNLPKFTEELVQEWTPKVEHRLLAQSVFSSSLAQHNVCLILS